LRVQAQRGQERLTIRGSRAARKKAFEVDFGDWIADQNARLEAHGIPGADLRPW
jgi:hypothetical protein